MSGTTKYEHILAEARRRRKDAGIVEVDEERIKLVIFSLCDSTFAFHGKNIKEILRLDKITYVPGTPDTILGIINVRGDIHSVLNIHKLLNLPEPSTTSASRVIIAESERVRSGIRVDSVIDVIDFPVRSIQPPISTLDRTMKEFVSGETTYGNVTILSVERLLEKLIS